MSRRHYRDPEPLILTLPAEPPSEAEIDAVLLAADTIAFEAGRTTLTLVLAGSRSQRVLNKDFDRSPAYGALRHLTQDVIGTKVDWCIHKGWLRIQYRDGLPLIYHTDEGFERVKNLWVDVLIQRFTEWVAANEPQHVWPYLEPYHRDIKHRLLDKIVAENRRDLVPVLRVWFQGDVRKVRTAINNALQRLGLHPLHHPNDNPPTAPSDPSAAIASPQNPQTRGSIR